MVRLVNGITNMVFTPNRDLPYGSTGRLYVTLKCRTTGKTKSTYTDTESYANEPRAVTMTIRINEAESDQDQTGYIRLDGPDYVTGYYSYLLYQANSNQEFHLLIDVGVAYFTTTTGQPGSVAYVSRQGSTTYTAYEK